MKLCMVFRVVAGNSLLSVENGEWDGKKWQTTSQDCLGVLLGFGLDLPRNTRLMGGNAGLRDQCQCVWTGKGKKYIENIGNNSTQSYLQHLIDWNKGPKFAIYVLVSAVWLSLSAPTQNL